jgi:hypothetical protein
MQEEVPKPPNDASTVEIERPSWWNKEMEVSVLPPRRVTLAEYTQYQSMFNQCVVTLPSIAEGLDSAYKYAHCRTLNKLNEYTDDAGMEVLTLSVKLDPVEGHEYVHNFLSKHFGGCSRATI